MALNTTPMFRHRRQRQQKINSLEFISRFREIFLSKSRHLGLASSFRPMAIITLKIIASVPCFFKICWAKTLIPLRSVDQRAKVHDNGNPTYKMPDHSRTNNMLWLPSVKFGVPAFFISIDQIRFIRCSGLLHFLRVHPVFP